ncbi:MAG: Rad52/Rad22 family DNA repair protein [Opitutae bacterium]
MIDLAALAAPFPFDSIHWRVGSTTKDGKRGMALAYLDARDVMDRLDKVCGSSWSDSYTELSGRIVCAITIDGVTRCDGAGDTAVEAEKGGLSDAFKRSAVKWGVGRYLYRIPTEWVALNEKRQIMAPPTLPHWALPSDDPANPDIPFEQIEQEHRHIDEHPITQVQADLIGEIINIESALQAQQRMDATQRTKVRQKYAKAIKLEAASEENLSEYYRQLIEYQRSN